MTVKIAIVSDTHGLVRPDSRGVERYYFAGTDNTARLNSNLASLHTNTSAPFAGQISDGINVVVLDFQ